MTIRVDRDAERVAFELVTSGHARVTSFELRRHNEVALYHVTIERTDEHLEEPVSFWLPINRCREWLALVDPKVLRPATEPPFEWPRAATDEHDDGLRMLAPDRASYDIGTSETRLQLSCVPSGDRVQLTIEMGVDAMADMLSPEQAIKVGRMLVWMGQRVHMRKRRHDAERKPDLGAELSRMDRGLTPASSWRPLLDSVSTGVAHIDAIRTARVGDGSVFDVSIEFPAGQGCTVRVERATVREFVSAHGRPILARGMESPAAPGHYALAKGWCCGPARSPKLARDGLSEHLAREGIVEPEQRYAISMHEVPL